MEISSSSINFWLIPCLSQSWAPIATGSFWSPWLVSHTWSPGLIMGSQFRRRYNFSNLKKKTENARILITMLKLKYKKFKFWNLNAWPDDHHFPSWRLLYCLFELEIFQVIFEITGQRFAPQRFELLPPTILLQEFSFTFFCSDSFWQRLTVKFSFCRYFWKHRRVFYLIKQLIR